MDDVNARRKKKKPKTELLRSHNHWHGKRAQWPLVDALPLCRSFNLLGSTEIYNVTNVLLIFGQ